MNNTFNQRLAHWEKYHGGEAILDIFSTGEFLEITTRYTTYRIRGDNHTNFIITKK